MGDSQAKMIPPEDVWVAASGHMGGQYADGGYEGSQDTSWGHKGNVDATEGYVRDHQWVHGQPG